MLAGISNHRRATMPPEETTTTATTTTPDKPWFDGFDAEKLVGVPADQVLRVPKDAADEKGWNAVWSRLGKPTDAKGYDFSDIKFADGTAPDATFVETMRA